MLRGVAAKGGNCLLALDWKRGLVRLGVVLVVGAAVVLGARIMVRPLGTVSIYLTGYVLLIGGPLALGTLYAGLCYIARASPGNALGDTQRPLPRSQLR